jgi:hypothetical protein
MSDTIGTPSQVFGHASMVIQAVYHLVREAGLADDGQDMGKVKRSTVGRLFSPGAPVPFSIVN